MKASSGADLVEAQADKIMDHTSIAQRGLNLLMGFISSLSRHDPKTNFCQ
jgi:hypothetical protein